MPSQITNETMSDQPGFDNLYDAWIEVFTTDDDGKYKLDPTEALEVTTTARQEVCQLYGYKPTEVDNLERIACKYAQVLPDFLEERVR